MIKVILLMGGLLSADGYATGNMSGLKSQLERIPNVTVHRYLWGDFNRYCRDAQATNGKLVVIGYSGGGMSATYLANNKYCRGVKIDLLIAYDPSPSWNMQPIGRNVKKSICYCNTRKMWVPPFYIGRRAIGGGVVRGSNVTRIYIRQQHLAVQFNKSLHRRTIREIRTL